MKKLLVLLIMAMFFLSCAAVQRYLDDYGMESSYEEIVEDFNPGNSGGFDKFLKEYSVEKATAPFNAGEPEFKSIGDWALEHPGGFELNQKKLFFKTPMSDHTFSGDRMVLYVYSRGPINGKRVILFVPGNGVSNLALRFLKNYFSEILKRGYSLAVYVPPYHLDRAPSKKLPDGRCFTADSRRNIMMISYCTSEVRTAVRILKSMGASDVSGLGGSMGGSLLLLAAQFESLSHVTAMIPVLDWNSLMIDNPAMKKLKDRLISSGYGESSMRRGYALISPASYYSTHPPGRLLIFAARYDRLTPLAVVNAYRLSHGKPLMKVYDRSHATILTTYDMYSDYAAQLDVWDKK